MDKQDKFFGYRRERLGTLPVLAADEPKAIVDGLDQPRYSGGQGERARALGTALSDLHPGLLEEYAGWMEDEGLSSRLGCLLEALGHPIEGLPVSSGPVALDPDASALAASK